MMSSDPKWLNTIKVGPYGKEIIVSWEYCYQKLLSLSRVMVKLADRRRRKMSIVMTILQKPYFLMYIQYINLERYNSKQIMQLPNGIRLY